jgi:ATP-binding cassette subfamily B protein
VIAGQWRRYLGATLAMGLSNVFIFGVPIVSKHAIDTVVALDVGAGLPLLVGVVQWWGDADVVPYLWVSASAVLVLTAIGGGFHFLRGRWAAMASETIVQSVRNSLFRHMEQLPVSFHDSADAGDLVQRGSSDVETLRLFLSKDVVEIGRATLLLLCVTPVLFWLDTRLALVSLALIPCMTLFAYCFFARLKTVFQAADEAEADMTAVLQENLTGIRVVRAYARQQHEIEKFAVKNRLFRDRHYRLVGLMSWYWGIGDALSALQVGLVMLLGARWVGAGRLSVGTLFAFLAYEAMIILPLRQVGRVLTDTSKAIVALSRLNEILHEPAESRAATAPSTPARGQLEFAHVTFGYAPHRPVLHDVSFTIAAGETIAFVGPPGAGKSTLIRLLLRLYDYECGSIRLDGRELKSLDRQYVRHQVGAVLQEPFLYSKTIRENLRVGRSAASLADLDFAVQLAAVDDAIAAFSRGYDTLVGERGVTLSGGQRQRLALARALLRNPPILVLDDAFSAIDTATEHRILEALSRRRGRQTTIIIAHRLSSIQSADRIFVFEAGRLVEAGDHHSLAAQHGIYRRFCDIQAKLDTEIHQNVSPLNPESN